MRLSKRGQRLVGRVRHESDQLSLYALEQLLVVRERCAPYFEMFLCEALLLFSDIAHRLRRRARSGHSEREQNAT